MYYPAKLTPNANTRSNSHMPNLCPRLLDAQHKGNDEVIRWMNAFKRDLSNVNEYVQVVLLGTPSSD
jgi:hypothetical protein